MTIGNYWTVFAEALSPPIVIPAMYVLYYNRISSQFQERRGWHNERYGFYRMGPGNWR